MRVLLPLRKQASSQPNSNGNDDNPEDQNSTTGAENSALEENEDTDTGGEEGQPPSASTPTVATAAATAQTEQEQPLSNKKQAPVQASVGAAGPITSTAAAAPLASLPSLPSASAPPPPPPPPQRKEAPHVSPKVSPNEERKRPAVNYPSPSQSLGHSSRKRRSPTNFLDTKPPAKKSPITNTTTSSLTTMGGNRAVSRNSVAPEVRDEPPPGDGNSLDDENRSQLRPLWSRSSNDEEEDDPALITDPHRRHRVTTAASSSSIVGSSSASSAWTTSATPGAILDEFALVLKKRGLEIVPQEGDGNCLFRAVSLQVYGDATMHADVRKQCMDFMERDEAHFSQFVDLTEESTFQSYIQRKRQDGVHGNHTEIQAISELFNRPIEVFSPDENNGATPLNIFHTEYKTDDPPIRLSYHDGNHYNAVVDPLVPTAGLGLGLPGLQPGLADKLQMAKAVAASDAAADQMAVEKALKESQDDELQRALKESSFSVEQMYNNQALALSDMDATYLELEQAALEQSMTSYSQNEHGKKKKASSSTSGRRRREGRSSPKADLPPVVANAKSDTSSTAARAPSSSSNVASLPTSVGEIPPAAAASVASTSSAEATSTRSAAVEPRPVGAVDECPQIVQELVMNGFPLAKVVHAYELIGENFDDLVAFLMSSVS